MDKYRNAINVLIGLLVFLLVFCAAYYYINYTQEKNKNLRLQKKLETVISQKNEAIQTILRYEKDQQKLEKQIGLNQAELETCESAKQRLKQKIKNLNKLVASGDAQIRLLSQENTAIRNNAIELTNKLVAVLPEYKALKKEAAALKSQISVLQKKIRRKETEISEKRSEADMANAEIAKLKIALAALEETAKKNQTEFEQEKQTLARKLERREAQLKKTQNLLSRAKDDLEFVARDHARLRILLKQKKARAGLIKQTVEKFPAAIEDIIPKIIAEVHFSTGESLLGEKQKDVLRSAAKKAGTYGSDYIVLVVGGSDRQLFARGHKYNNLELSANRALSVVNFLLKTTKEIPQIGIVGLNDIYAPPEPVNNPAERKAVIFIAKKNPSGLDGLMANLRGYFPEEK